MLVVLKIQVHFLTGVDEHGQKVQEAAAKKGLEPQDFVDSLTSSFTGLGGAIMCPPTEFTQLS